MKIGAQFFTVRDFCKTLDDFAETLKKVADIGYENVQISGVCDYNPEWLEKELRKNGLKCVVTHISPDRLVGETADVAQAHSVFGCDYIGLGWHSFDEEKASDELKAFFDKYIPVAETLKAHGKTFMYHNHDQEFIKIDGKPILQHMAEDVPADLMGFIPDTFWIQAGGGDPAYWIEKLSGRVPCIHLKDYSFGRKMAAIGEGNINFERVFAAAEKAGTKYMLVEQDDCNGEDPFECLKRSYEYLKSRGF